MINKVLSPVAYVIPFFLAFGLAAVLTPLVRRYAMAKGILDKPQMSPDRKIQAGPVPLLGGLAVYASFTIAVLFYTFFTERLLGGYLLPKHIFGILLGGGLLMIGGYLDDRFTLRWHKQLLWPIAAALVIIASGIGVSYITNPLGGTIALDQISFTVFSAHGLPYKIVLFADIFAFVWLLGSMFTTKFLDGLDGLVSGITAIGSFIIFFLSLTKDVAQPETALLAILVAGAMAGFLLFNIHPARVFLGEGGSLWAGFMLGVLAIISGAKIATALLILGIPLLDVLWVVIRRLLGRRSPFAADRGHLHFRLLDVGFSHRGAVLFLWMTSLLFGVAALFSNTKAKLIWLIVLGLFTVALLTSLVALHRKRTS